MQHSGNKLRFLKTGKVFTITTRNLFHFWKLKNSQTTNSYNYFNSLSTLLLSDELCGSTYLRGKPLFFLDQESPSSLDSNSAAISHNSDPSSLFLSPRKIPLIISLIKHLTTLTPPLYLALTYLCYSRLHTLICLCTDSSAAMSVTTVSIPIFTQLIYSCSFLMISL